MAVLLLSPRIGPVYTINGDYDNRRTINLTYLVLRPSMMRKLSGDLPKGRIPMAKQKSMDDGKPRIRIFDTSLRDGEQAPGCSMGIQDKLRLAYQLERLGVDIIEAGFPIASEDDFNAVRLISREVRGPVVAGLAR